MRNQNQSYNKRHQQSQKQQSNRQFGGQQQSFNNRRSPRQQQFGGPEREYYNESPERTKHWQSYEEGPTGGYRDETDRGEESMYARGESSDWNNRGIGSSRNYRDESDRSEESRSSRGDQFRGNWNSSGQSQSSGKSFSGIGPKGYARSDERIKEEISDCLTDSHELDASDIEIKVVSGEVTLTGEVPERKMKRMAEDLVEEVAGVRDVTNQIKVKRDSKSGETQRMDQRKSGREEAQTDMRRSTRGEESQESTRHKAA